MGQPNHPVAIVTGASAGIGRSVALQLAGRGYHVFLAARRVDRLGQLADEISSKGQHATAVQTDVADQAQVQALVDRAIEQTGRVDVMVNNAGFGIFARVHETTPQAMREIMDVNFMGVFYGCLAVVPVMIRQRSGHIFNLSSVIGKRGSPFHGAYSATKFAVAGLTESLRVEMMPYDVRVTLVCPALTDTEFFDHGSGGRTAKSSFAKFKKMMSPDDVARKMVAVVGRPRPEIVFTPGGKFLTIVSALCPGLADRMMKVYHDDLAKLQGPGIKV